MPILTPSPVSLSMSYSAARARLKVTAVALTASYSHGDVGLLSQVQGRSDVFLVLLKPPVYS